MFPKILDDLIRSFQKLPGIGRKSATRLSLYLLGNHTQKAVDLATSLINAVENIKRCSICNMLTDQDPCSLCSNDERNSEQLCIIADTQDLLLVEATREYKGYYFVLGDLLSPLDGIGPDQINFPMLREYVSHHEVKELILALNPSAEGESTMHFLTSQLGEQVEKITRLSTGLPFGGDIEYTSVLTLGDALKRRYKIDN
jgi:recombination protein RecR